MEHRFILTRVEGVAQAILCSDWNEIFIRTGILCHETAVENEHAGHVMAILRDKFFLINSSMSCCFAGKKLKPKRS